MGVWDKYQSRINAHGGSKYNAAYKREVRYINSKLPDNLSYFTVDIYPREYGFNIESNTSLQNKISQNVAIVNSDNLDEKTIYSMPSEDIELGALVYWMNSYWLVYERDLNTTLYTKAKLLLCNHLLKWIDSENNIISQWCVIEDGTKLRRFVRHSLVYRKRCAKSILLIAGTP